MKQGIHPDYHEITVVMTDGTSYPTRSTPPDTKSDPDVCRVCSMISSEWLGSMSSASTKARNSPVACSIPLEKDAAPYQAGFYTLDMRSIYVGDFRRLELGRVKLVPEAAGARKVA